MRTLKLCLLLLTVSLPALTRVEAKPFRAMELMRVEVVPNLVLEASLGM